MTLYLTNAFSLNMLPNIDWAINLEIQKIDKIRAGEIIEYFNDMNKLTNAIGHADTDTLVRNDLKIDTPFGQRLTVEFKHKDLMIVAQYKGPRLPDGTTVLPDGATIEYFKINFD